MNEWRREQMLPDFARLVRRLRREPAPAASRYDVSPEQRAYMLLLSYMTEEQRSSYLRDHTFIVTGSDGRLYRIFRHRDIYHVSDGRWDYCAYPKGYIPRSDRDLATMLFLESDARGFRKVANRRYRYRDHYY